MNKKVLYVFLAILMSSQAQGEPIPAEPDGDAFQEGLLDRVLSREKTSVQDEPAQEHDTFEDRLRKEKERQRIEDIGTKREGTPAKVLKDLLY